MLCCPKRMLHLSRSPEKGLCDELLTARTCRGAGAGGGDAAADLLLLLLQKGGTRLRRRHLRLAGHLPGARLL